MSVCSDFQAFVVTFARSRRKDPIMTEKSENKSNETVPAKLEIALVSADRVVRDFNAAHAKKVSSSNGAGPRIHSKTDRFDCSAEE